MVTQNEENAHDHHFLSPVVASRIQERFHLSPPSIKLGWIWFAKVKLIVSSTGL